MIASKSDGKQREENLSRTYKGFRTWSEGQSYTPTPLDIPAIQAQASLYKDVYCRALIPHETKSRDASQDSAHEIWNFSQAIKLSPGFE